MVVGLIAGAAMGALSGGKSSKSSSPDIQRKNYGEVEGGLGFGTSGNWQTGNRNIEGMSTAMVGRNDPSISSLANQQFNLGSALLQPQFQQSRAKVSNALASRGMGQTSTFANAMTAISGEESMAQSSLLSNILKSEQQDALSRSQLGAQMEMAGLDSRDKRMSSRYGYEGQYLGAQASMYGAQMGADSAAKQGKGSAIGSIGSAAMTAFSDRRLKKNIKKIGKILKGLYAYEFNYIDEDNSKEKHTGVMAQELIKIIPEAIVRMANGFLGVNYGLLNKII